MIHKTLCDWPLPACMAFTSLFCLRYSRLPSGPGKPEAKCVPAFWALLWMFALPGTLVAHTFPCLLCLLNVTWAERPP